jgi:hypothetical protein
MKKIFISAVLLSTIFAFNSCKGKTDEAKPEAEVTATEATTTEGIAPVGESKSYTVTATPDSVIIGKDKEATVKIINLKAMELSDPDGKVTGIELSYEYEVTNNNKIGGSGIVMDPDKFRLVLDNGNKISHEDYTSLSTDAESTTSMPGNKFKLPAGTKPTALNLFYNETSASVKLELK